MQETRVLDKHGRRIARASTLAQVLSGLAPLEEDFPEVADPPTTPEELL